MSYSMSKVVQITMVNNDHVFFAPVNTHTLERRSLTTFTRYHHTSPGIEFCHCVLVLWDSLWSKLTAGSKPSSAFDDPVNQHCIRHLLVPLSLGISYLA